MSKRRVVVTGLGPVTPIGVGVDAFWQALLDGRSGTHRIESFDPSRFDSQIGGEIADVRKVNDFVPKGYRKAGKIMARDIELAVVAAWHAVMDAGLRTKCIIERADAEGPQNLDSARFGANIGAGLICADLGELSEALAQSTTEDLFSLRIWGNEGMQNLTPLWLLKFLPNMLACHVTIVHDAQGPSNTITCGEASSHLAIGEAYRTIERGTADVCICGGAESKANPMALIRQSLGKRLSTRNDAPESACRPFGKDRDGTVATEGGGLVILESLEHAQARGARIYAELVGFGAAHDAHTPMQPTTPHPEGRGVALAAQKALRDAGLANADVRLVVPMACGLSVHDASEAAGLRSLFDDVPVMAVNGGIGNNGAGTGAIDFIAACLAVHHNTITAAVNSDPLDTECGLNVVLDGPVDAPVDVALTTAYALGGGQNAALALKAFR